MPKSAKTRSKTEFVRRALACGCLVFILGLQSANADPSIACSLQAVDRAKDLLASHLCPRDKYLLFSQACLDYMGFTGQWSVGDTAQKRGTLRTARGRRQYDILEVPGAVYKSSYRMRFYYNLLHGKCVLAREEILED